MKEEHLFQALGQVREEYIQDAVPPKKKRKARQWLKWSGLAACLCVIVVGTFLLPQEPAVQQWSPGFEGEDYFRHNKTLSGLSSSKSASLAAEAIPYEYHRSFSDDRQRLEAVEIIPVMDDHPLLHASGYYTEDGSLYDVTFQWQRYGEREDYSTLTVTAAPEEVELPPACCIVVEVDEDGNIITPSVTVTERDGVQIITQGSRRQEKTMTWQTDQGWYHIVGSFNDSYEDMATLLDWFWAHPIDFDSFAMEKGDILTYGTRAEYPEEFVDHIPDFPSLSYLEDLTEGLVTEKVETDRRLAFLWEGQFVKVYTSGVDQAQEAWRVISSLQ